MTKFNKRHYEAIALAMQSAIMERVTSSTEVNGVWQAALALADTFADDNPQFKRERFISACAPGANVKLRTRYKVVA